jgi:hypothetical protein
MALDRKPAMVDEMDGNATGPLTASLRWGLGWTIVVATLGASAGCVSSVPTDDPINRDDSYSTCVAALGEMPDAVDQHIDPCRAVAAAIARKQ